MFITKAKFSGYTIKKTQINITFSIPKDMDEVQLIQSEKTHGYLAYNRDEFKKKVEDFMKNKSIGVDEDGKSESVKLRGKIFILWEELFAAGKTERTAEQFYVDCMQWIRTELINQLL